MEKDREDGKNGLKWIGRVLRRKDTDNTVRRVKVMYCWWNDMKREMEKDWLGVSEKRVRMIGLRGCNSRAKSVQKHIIKVMPIV